MYWNLGPNQQEVWNPLWSVSRLVSAYFQDPLLLSLCWSTRWCLARSESKTYKNGGRSEQINSNRESEAIDGNVHGKPRDVNIGNQELFELALEESREKISKTNEIFRFIEYRDFDLTEGL